MVIDSLIVVWFLAGAPSLIRTLEQNAAGDPAVMNMPMPTQLERD